MFRKHTITVPIFSLTLLLSCQLLGSQNLLVLKNLGDIGEVLHNQERAASSFISKGDLLHAATGVVLEEITQRFGVVSMKNLMKLEQAIVEFEQSINDLRATNHHPQVGSSFNHTLAKNGTMRTAYDLVNNGKKIRSTALNRLKQSSPRQYINYYVTKYLGMDPRTLTEDQLAHALEHSAELNQLYKDKILTFGPEECNRELKQYFAQALVKLHHHLTRR